MTNADIRSDESNRPPSDARGGTRSLWVWLGGLAATVAIVVLAVSSGIVSWVLAVVGTVLVVDMISGLHLITPLLFYRVLLPLVITIVLVPLSLIWPGDPGTSHGRTVRARFLSLGRMWLGYWNLHH